MATQGSRKTLTGLAQAVVYSLIFLGILGAVNFLANRYNKSYDTTSNKQYTLSDQTAKIAKNLKDKVTITYWDQSSKFQGARDLLGRYSNLSSNVDVQYMDADKNRTKAIAAGVKTIPTIYVEVSGNKRQEAKSLTEEEITGAMIRAVKTGTRKICFTLDSGEHSLADTGRDGYSALKELVEKANYETATLNLLKKAEIPMDCTVTVVAGPKRDYIPPVVAAIKGYVEGGGKAMILLDPPTKFGGTGVDDNAELVSVLGEWGVEARKDLVIDKTGVGQIFGLGPEFPLVTKYESHQIVREMKETPTGFPLARSLDVKKTDKTTAEALFATSEDSFSTANLASGEIRESKNDRKGPLTLGVAGTYNTGKENGNGRFVVVGTSNFVVNGFLKFNGNRDLVLNMFNWLSNDEELISIRPKDPEDRRLNMNVKQSTLLFYASVVVIPLLVVVAGVGVWWRRR